MIKLLIVGTCLAFGPVPLYAQLNLLTLREAASIVEKVPAVDAARTKGECPILSAYYESTEDLGFGVRRQCGSWHGSLIERYTVNRRTGVVTLWGDNPQPVADAAGEQFARQLVRQAANRVLTQNEARCLALEAAKALPGWDGTDVVASVEFFRTLTAAEIQFTAKSRSRVQPAVNGRLLTVNLTTARVRDDQTGQDLMSAGVGGLTGKILVLREPLVLTNNDALSIAFRIPLMASQTQDGCYLSAGGVFSSEYTEVGVGCDGSQKSGGPVISVNLRTGRVIGERGVELESAEAFELVSQLLEAKRTQRKKLESEVDTICGVR